MKQTTRIICITLCVLLIALSAAGVIWALYNKFASNEAHADYEDLAGTDTLVNFNQEIQNSNINHTFDTYNIWYDFATNLTTGHNYYISFNISNIGSEASTLFTSTANHSSRQTLITIDHNGRYGYIGILAYGYLTTYANTAFTISNLNAIDLDLMFGANNIPTLEQAQEYFTAEYYSYNSGTPIPYSKDYLQGYADGANDIYESMTITYNAYTIGSTSATYANNTIERGTFAFDNQYGAYTFSGVISVNLTANVERGTNFDIDFSLMIPDLQGENNPSYAESTYYLHFAYVDENNVLNDIVSIKAHYIGSLTNQYTASFVLPITTSTLYIYVDYNTIGDNFSPTKIITAASSITFKSTDMGLLMNNSYQRGYNEAAASYYQGTENYYAIYNLGYQNGLATQNATLGAMEYIGAAFSGIGQILSIELLPGVPFSLFILLPLMFGLIAFVVKLSKGGD